MKKEAPRDGVVGKAGQALGSEIDGDFDGGLAVAVALSMAFAGEVEAKKAKGGTLFFASSRTTGQG